jgi:hypothetical protein
MLANKAVTAVRQRITRDLLGRRGRTVDPTWALRRLLLRGRERLSPPALARMWNGCVDNDPTGQILSAWIAKEELRALCGAAARGGHPGEIRDRLYAFYRWCADAQRPRMRAVDGSGELPVASYELFSDTEILGRMALDRMLAGLSTRRYPVALEPVGARTEKGRDRHLEVGGVTPVRRADRDRARRVAGREPVRAGPGGFHGRRGALR